MADLDISNVIDSMVNDAKKILSKQTNADRIRSMTDEELAEFFSKIDKGWDAICGSYISIKPGVFICGRDDFAKQIFEWLQSEAE